MNNLEAYLESEGFDINLWGGQCPFQIEANQLLGFSVYFRARHTNAILDLFSNLFCFDSADSNIIGLVKSILGMSRMQAT